MVYSNLFWFFCDVGHKVPHVVDGHRVTLTYNLYLDDYGRAYGKDVASESGAAKPPTGRKRVCFQLSRSSPEIEFLREAALSGSGDDATWNMSADSFSHRNPLGTRKARWTDG